MAAGAARAWRVGGARVAWAALARRMIVLGMLGATIDCGTDAVGVDSCKQIEEARCRQAPACGISLEPPYHTSGNDVSACIRAYDISCLHGLDVGDPGSVAVSACVAAIEQPGNCVTVSAPESDPACAWLAPATAASDAETTADTTTTGDAE